MLFAVGLLFEGTHDSRSVEDASWELQVRLIQATSEKEALLKAEQLGEKKEHGYRSSTNIYIQWKFRKVVQIYDLSEAKFGEDEEIFSVFLNANEGRSFLKPVC